MKKHWKQETTALVVLSLFSFLSYGQTLMMYWWWDDYTHLYFIQQGRMHQFPHHFLSVVAKITWKLFGFDVWKYYLLGIILFTFCSYLLYRLLRLWLKQFSLALASTCVFAAGYVGLDGMKMLLGDGYTALVGLILILGCWLCFFSYFQNKSYWWLIATYLFYGFSLEVAPSRAMGLVVVIIAADWLFSRPVYFKKIFFRNLGFLAIFIIQSFVHPSSLILNYPIESTIQRIALFNSFQWDYLFNQIGSFGNLFFPSFYLEKIWFFSGRIFGSHPARWWFSGLPILLMIIVYAQFILRQWRITFLLIAWFLISGIIIPRIPGDKLDHVFILNGGLWLSLFLGLIVCRVTKYAKHGLFTLVAAFGFLLVFLISKPDFLLVSSHRYLLMASIVPSLAMVLFVTNNNIARNIVFLTPMLLFISTRFLSGIISQRQFVTDYSIHARRLYIDLKRSLPEVNKKTVIYIEGASRDLNYSVGDASRVGEYGSEAAFAVHYRIGKENFILPQRLAEIPAILREQPDLTLDDIHTFIYDEVGLRDTSSILRSLLADQMTREIKVAKDKWQLDKTAEVEIISMLPLKWEVYLKASLDPQILSNRSFKLTSSWQYNTYGLLTEEKETTVDLIIDGQWHRYQTTIPAAGEYLKGLSLITDFPGKLEIGESRFKYVFSTN